jgi:hypothetical protein
VDRERLIERERRWAVPAAVAAFFTALLFLAGVIVQQSAGLYSGSSTARQLESVNAHSGVILLSFCLPAVAFLALIGPLLYLFRAAQGRSPRVRAGLVGFVFIGPALFAGALIAKGVGATDVASKVVSLAPEPDRTYAQFQAQVKKDPTQIDKVTIYSAGNSLEVQQADGEFYAVQSISGTDESKVTGDLEGAGIDHETDSDTGTGPPDARATHLTESSTTLQAANGLGITGSLGITIAMVYVCLQALRTGLLTRFTGSLGIALGAAVIFIPPIILFSAILWSGFLVYIGLVFLGRVRRGRPPAWDAGQAIPWPRPGEQPIESGDGGDAIDGDATEVGDDQARDSESGPSTPQKRKRKSRD